MIPTPKAQKQPAIGSRYISNFGTGLFLLNREKAPENSLVDMNNLKIGIDKTLQPRMRLRHIYHGDTDIQSKPITVSIGGDIYIFFIQNGKVRYINYTEDKSVSHEILDPDNNFSNVARAMLRMAGNMIVITNGVDKLAFVDTTTMPFIITKFTLVADPTVAPTLTPSAALTGSGFPYYACVTFNSTVGETAASPIQTANVKAARDVWLADGTQSITINRGSVPSGAVSWNIYVALASNGGSIQNSDMLLLASAIDINQATLVDNGTLAINISAPTAPSYNSTDGPICKYSMTVANGRMILYGDVNSPENIWLGGTGNYPLDFSSSRGGYRAEVAKGTGYVPKSVITYRTGQGIAAIRIDTSNSENDPRYYYMTPQTITYGTTSFVVWGIEEQSSGATGVISPYSLTTEKDNLYFYSDYGFYTTGTKPQIQNVLSTDRISATIQDLVNTIRSDSSDLITSCSFDNTVYWCVPVEGNKKPNVLLTYDLGGNGMWYINRIALDFLFVVDDDNIKAALHGVHDGDIYIIEDISAANDILNEGDGGTAFPVSAIGAPIGNNPAKSMYNYLLHSVFTFTGGRGSVTVGVSYTNKSGKVKSKQKTKVFSTYNQNIDNSFADVFDTFNGKLPDNKRYLVGFADVGGNNSSSSGSENDGGSNTVSRIKVPVNAEYRDVQWWINGQDLLLDFELVGVEYKTMQVGIGEDL